MSSAGRTPDATKALAALPQVLASAESNDYVSPYSSNKEALAGSKAAGDLELPESSDSDDGGAGAGAGAGAGSGAGAGASAHGGSSSASSTSSTPLAPSAALQIRRYVTWQSDLVSMLGPIYDDYPVVVLPGGRGLAVACRDTPEWKSRSIVAKTYIIRVPLPSSAPPSERHAPPTFSVLSVIDKYEVTSLSIANDGRHDTQQPQLVFRSTLIP